MDELITDKMINVNGRTYLLYLLKGFLSYEYACDYGLKLGNNWRMINVRDNMILHGVFQLNFWIYDNEAKRNDTLFDGRRIHCGYMMDPVMMAPHDYVTNGVFIREII